MIRVKCHECRKHYNWEDDCFCPHCGAFNQAKSHGFDREVVDEAPRTSIIGKSKPARTSRDYSKFLHEVADLTSRDPNVNLVQCLILFVGFIIFCAIFF